jgi:hypothetical protein
VISISTVLGLAPQLSAAVVAFTIEADNEFEQRVQHITTRHGGSRERGVVWLSSLAMWFNCLRGLDDAGTGLTVAELERRVRMSTNLDGMRRWGYVTIDGVGRVKRGGPKPRPRPGSMLALTRRGRAAAEMWRPLPGEIESRWRERFGADAVGRLRGALVAIASQLDVPLPDFMPIGSTRWVGLSWAAARERAALGPGGAAATRCDAGAQAAAARPLARALLQASQQAARAAARVALRAPTSTSASLPEWTSWGTTTRTQRTSRPHVCGSPSRPGRPEAASSARRCSIRTPRGPRDDRARLFPNGREGAVGCIAVAFRSSESQR